MLLLFVVDIKQRTKKKIYFKYLAIKTFSLIIFLALSDIGMGGREDKMETHAFNQSALNVDKKIKISITHAERIKNRKQNDYVLCLLACLPNSLLLFFLCKKQINFVIFACCWSYVIGLKIGSRKMGIISGECKWGY